MPVNAGTVNHREHRGRFGVECWSSGVMWFWILECGFRIIKIKTPQRCRENLMKI